MHRNVPKITIFILVVALVGLLGAAFPSLFISGVAPAGSAATGTVPAGPPLIVLPSLSAGNGIGAPDAAESSSEPASHPVPRPPTIGAAAALVADLTTGKTFYGNNAAVRWPLASVSKLMTAVIATDLLQQNQHVAITEQMTAVDPSEHILQVGDSYTVSDLFRVMLLPSNNVAAEALADFSGRAQFVAAMNAKAKAWGMADTYYDDPSGLSAANESTPNDLLKLAQHIYAEYPLILAVTRMTQATVTELQTGKPVSVVSINHFAGNASFIGGKTGYTDEADGNLLSIFSYGGRPIFIVVMGTPDSIRFDDTQKLLDWFRANF